MRICICCADCLIAPPLRTLDYLINRLRERRVVKFYLINNYPLYCELLLSFQLNWTIFVCRKICGNTWCPRVYIQVRQFMSVIFARGRWRMFSARTSPRSFVPICWKLMPRTFRHQTRRRITSSKFFPVTLAIPINQKHCAKAALFTVGD